MFSFVAFSSIFLSLFRAEVTQTQFTARSAAAAASALLPLLGAEPTTGRELNWLCVEQQSEVHSQTRVSIISTAAVIAMAAAADLWLDDYRRFAKTSLGGGGGRGGADEEKGRPSRSHRKLHMGEDEHTLRRHRLLLSVCEVNR